MNNGLLGINRRTKNNNTRNKEGARRRLNGIVVYLSGCALPDRKLMTGYYQCDNGNDARSHGE